MGQQVPSTRCRDISTSRPEKHIESPVGMETSISATDTSAQVQAHPYASPCQMASHFGPDWSFWYPTWHRNGPRCPQNAPPAPHTAVLAPPGRLGLSQDFRGGPIRLSAKGIVLTGLFGCGATRCHPEMGRNTLDQRLFSSAHRSQRPGMRGNSASRSGVG